MVTAFRPPTKNIRNFTFSSANINDSIPVIRNSDRLITVGGVVDLADVDSALVTYDTLKLYNNGIPVSVRMGIDKTIDTLNITGNDTIVPVDMTIYRVVTGNGDTLLLNNNGSDRDEIWIKNTSGNANTIVGLIDGTIRTLTFANYEKYHFIFDTRDSTWLQIGQ